MIVCLVEARRTVYRNAPPSPMQDAMAWSAPCARSNVPVTADVWLSGAGLAASLGEEAESKTVSHRCGFVVSLPWISSRNVFPPHALGLGLQSGASLNRSTVLNRRCAGLTTSTEPA
jgi:hypothetical protein